MILAELALDLEYQYIGAPAQHISSIAPAQEAGPGQLGIARSERDILTTQAEAVLTVPRIVKTNKALLFCRGSIECGAVRAAQAMVRRGILPDYTIPETYTPIPDQSMRGENCSIGAHTVIQPFCVIGSNVAIGKNCLIEPYVWIGSGTKIGDHVIIRAGAKIGAPAFYHYMDELDRGPYSFSGVGSVRIADYAEIGCQSVIQRGTFSDTFIGGGTKIGDLVEIGHDVRIGRCCKIVSQTGIAGNAAVGNFVQVFGQVGIANYVTVGDYAIIMAKSLVAKNVESGKTISGPFGRSRMEELRLQVKIRKMLGGM